MSAKTYWFLFICLLVHCSSLYAQETDRLQKTTGSGNSSGVEPTAAKTMVASTSNSTVTVRSFGAIGDGLNDDTDAIQRAVENANDVVLLPKGRYRITKTIRIDLNKIGWMSIEGHGVAQVLMEGNGPAFDWIGTHEGTADPTSVKEAVWSKERAPGLSGIEILGASKEADGIRASGLMQFTMDKILIHKCRNGVHLVNRNRNIIVSQCNIYENSGVGILYDKVNLHQSNIVGSHISYCSGGGIVMRGGEVRNVHIGTCDIESNMGVDSPETANVLIDSTTGSTDEVAITGCTLQHNSKSPNSANIRVIGRGITSQKNDTPTREGHIAISGNVFSDVRVNIHLQHARGVSIVGNTFWEGFDRDILIEDSEAIVVGANDMDRNPRYIINNNWGKDKGGIVLRRCNDCKLTGLLIKGVWEHPAAVELDGCERCTVTDLSILDSDNVGLLLNACKNCFVNGCMIRDDRIESERKLTETIREINGTNNRLVNNW